MAESAKRLPDAAADAAAGARADPYSREQATPAHRSIVGGLST